MFSNKRKKMFGIYYNIKIPFTYNINKKIVLLEVSIALHFRSLFRDPSKCILTCFELLLFK